MNINNVTYIANGQRLTSTRELAEALDVPHKRVVKKAKEALKELQQETRVDAQGNLLLDRHMAFTVAYMTSPSFALEVVRRIDQLEGEV